MLVSFLHLIFAIVNLLLQFVVLSLESFVVLHAFLEGLLGALEVSFEVTDGLVLVL